MCPVLTTSRAAARRVWLLGSTLGIAACGGDGPVQTEPAVASIAVTAPLDTLSSIGATQPYTAVARDADGRIVSGTSFTWSATPGAVATIDAASGLAVAVGNGTATITATAGSVSGDTGLVVRQRATSLQLSPERDTILAPTLSLQLGAVARDAGGTPVLDEAVAWSSLDADVATVDPTTGLVTAAAAGSARIVAQAGSVADTATLTVRNGLAVGDYVLLTDYGSVLENEYRTGGIFAAWWDDAYDFSVDAETLLNVLGEVRTESLGLGLRDPPNPAFGTYANVYIHVPGPGNDNYPDDWGAGVSRDGDQLPYMTLGTNVSGDSLFIRHEGFHLFQFSATSPGFAYAGDSGWYTEASANWYLSRSHPTHERAFVTAALVPANPHLALWHGPLGRPAGDPANWNRDVRQYGLNAWLHYLTVEAGVAEEVLTAGYYAGTTRSPQQYLFDAVPDLRTLFGDWAARNTAEMDYIGRAQWNRSLTELAAVGDPADFTWYVAELVDEGTGGAWLEPPAATLPRGWAYNVVRIANSAAASYTFEVDGDPSGSEGAAALFESRVLVRSSMDGDAIYPVALAAGQDGSVTIDAAATDGELFLIVAAVPAHFTGHQTYPYRVRITRVGP